MTSAGKLFTWQWETGFSSGFYFDVRYCAIVGPVTFIMLNYISYKYNIFKAMELEEKIQARYIIPYP